MSSVLKRFQGESDFQVLTDARHLRGELVNWTLNTNNVPKSIRASVNPKVHEALNNLVSYIKKAKKCYPSGANAERELEKRKDFISKALDCTTDIWDGLQAIYDIRYNHGGVNLNSLEPLLDELVEITNALKKWRKVKISQYK